MYSNWPTYPQLYANGRLVGGLDVIKELAEEGQLKQELGLDNQAATSGDSHEALITRVERKITAGLRAEKVVIEDMSDGCGAKFDILVVSGMFEGLREYNRTLFPSVLLNVLLLNI